MGVVSPSAHLLAPELKQLVASYSAADTTNMSIEELRARVRNLPDPLVNNDPDIAVTEENIARGGSAPPLRLLVYRPADLDASPPIFLYFHGGGYIMGKAEQSHVLNLERARNARCVVVSVDYRLAPEHPFPAALEDGYHALCWIGGDDNPLAIDRTRIAVGGESAGAGLAAGLTIMARDRGGVSPAFQLLLYAMLDDRTGTEAVPHPYTGEFIWNAQSNQYCWGAVLPLSRTDATISSYAAPARATDLRHLPPAYIAVGALDLYLEENIDYARRLLRAGVAVDLHVYAGAIHAFDLIGVSNLGSAFQAANNTALRRAFSSLQLASRLGVSR